MDEGRYGKLRCQIDNVGCPRYALSFELNEYFTNAYDTIGFGMGAFFSLAGSSFSAETSYMTPGGTIQQQTVKQVARDMGKGLWNSGKGFGKVGAMYAGIECVIESVRHSHPKLLCYDTEPHFYATVPSEERHHECCSCWLCDWWTPSPS